MDILKPPTDNLYKFIAISGLLIFLASFIFPQILDRDRIIRVAEVEGELRVYELQLDTLNSLDPQSDNPNQKKEDALEIKRRAMELEKGVAELRKKHEVSKALGGYARRWQLFGIIGMSFGLVVMVSGFYLWYSRLQKYEDRLMKRKADDSV